MSTHEPDEDELALKERLITLVDGPAPTPPAAVPPQPSTPPQPTERPRDWLDGLLEERAPEPEPVEEAEETKPERKPAEPTHPAKPKKPKAKAKKKRRRRPKRQDPDVPRSAWDNQPPAPRQSLLDAWNDVPYRLRWLAIHAVAAGIGWRMGLVTWATDTGAWYAAGHWTNSSAWVLYAFAGLLAALYRIARKWALLFRILASIPIASVAVGLLLYGVGYHH